MKRQVKRMLAVLTVAVMIFGNTMLLHAESMSGNVYGAWYNATLYLSSTSVSASMSGEPESSSEPTPYLKFSGSARTSDGDFTTTIYGKGYGYCYDSSLDVVGASYAQAFYYVDGYSVGSLTAY